MKLFAWIKNIFLSEKKRKQQALKDLSANFATLDRLEKKRILEWDWRQRRLFIEGNLALLMMQTPEKWQNFIRNVFNWLYMKEASKTYEKWMLQEELKAVREWRKAHNGKISGVDADRIRRKRREELQQQGAPEIKPQSFEFYVVSINNALKPSDPNGTNAPVGNVLLVGNYDYDTDSLQMVEWERVQQVMGSVVSHL